MRDVPPPTGPDDGAACADPTLLEELSALTPEERLRWNDRVATTVLELRHGFAAAQPHHPARPPGGERD